MNIIPVAAAPTDPLLGFYTDLLILVTMLGWFAATPVLLVASLLCLGYNLLGRGVGWFALTFEALVVGSNLVYAFTAVPLSIAILDAPGAYMIIGFALSALLAVALSAGIVVSAAISRSKASDAA